MILAGSFLPVIGFACLLLAPLPLAVLGSLEGHRPMSIAELMIEVTLFIAVSPMWAVYFLIGCAPMSAVMFMLSRKDFRASKNYTGAESLLVCSGVSIAAKLILVAVFYFMTGRSILMPDASQMESVMSELYANQPALHETVRHVLAIFPYLMPSMLCIYAGAEVFVNYSAHCSVMKRYPKCENSLPELPAFSSWRFPVSLMIVSALSLVAGYFINIDDWFDGAIFVTNLQMVLNVFMFIHGLAFAFWLMEGFRLRRGTKVIICCILAVPFFWMWLIVMGMSDMLLNLRDRIKFSK